MPWFLQSPRQTAITPTSSSLTPPSSSASGCPGPKGEQRPAGTLWARPQSPTQTCFPKLLSTEAFSVEPGWEGQCPHGLPEHPAQAGAAGRARESTYPSEVPGFRRGKRGEAVLRLSFWPRRGEKTRQDNVFTIQWLDVPGQSTTSALPRRAMLGDMAQETRQLQFSQLGSLQWPDSLQAPAQCREESSGVPSNSQLPTLTR